VIVMVVVVEKGAPGASFMLIELPLVRYNWTRFNWARWEFRDRSSVCKRILFNTEGILDRNGLESKRFDHI